MEEHGNSSYLVTPLNASIVIRLRYNYDTMTHLTTTEVSEIMICGWFDCDTPTTKKIDMFIFARVEWKQVRAIHRSRIVVESQL